MVLPRYLYSFVRISYTAGTDAGKQKKTFEQYHVTLLYSFIHIYDFNFIVQFIYMKPRLKCKECMQTCQNVLYSLPSPYVCVCVCVCVMSVVVECWYWLSAANERVSYWNLTWM